MTEINLEPPAPEPTNMEILDSWGIKPTWDKDNRLWHLPGLGYLHEIIEMDEEETKVLTSRDRHAVEKAIEEYGEWLMGHNLDDDVWESELGWYSRVSDSSRGPTINVKLHDTWGAWRIMEKLFDMDLDEAEVDPQYIEWSDTIDHEMDWFKSEYIDGQFSEFEHLDSDRFVRGGRSGGWLVYDIHSRGSGALTLGEATELRKVWEDVPEMVRNVAHDIVVRQWAHYFENTLWDEAVDDWREREEDAKAEAVRTNDFEAAKRHQENLDEDVDQYKPDYMFEDLWVMFYEALPEED